MQVISLARLREFWTVHPQAETPLKVWHRIVSSSRWETPADVKAAFGTADFVVGNRVIFNIGGNKYRLVTYVMYRVKRVLIKFVGTHPEYDAIDPETVE